MNQTFAAPAPQERRPTEAIAQQPITTVGRGSGRAVSRSLAQ